MKHISTRIVARNQIKTGRLTPHFRQWWRVWVGVSVVLFLVVVGQFLYPHERSLPFARLDGARVGSRTQTQVVQDVIDGYSNVPLALTVTGPAKNLQPTATTLSAGIAPNTAAVSNGLRYYPWWERVVPFSLLVRGLRVNQAVTVQLDEQKFWAYADTQLAACRVAPKNAAVTVQNGAVVLDSAKDGQSCDREKLRRALQKTKLARSGVRVALSASVVRPARSDKDVASKLKAAQALAGTKLSLRLLEQEYPVPREVIASWLVFVDDKKDPKNVLVDVDTAKMGGFLQDMQKKIYIAPGTTVIQTTDSVEKARSEGAVGRGLQVTQTAEALKKQLLDGDGTVTAAVVAIPANVRFERSYSAGRAGLQALLKDLAADKGDYAIAVRLADGSLVSANGDKRYHPASTYKMYVAYSLLKRVAAGQIKWEDTAAAGKNISQCFDVMIINSDNTCAEWLGDTIGWQHIQNEVRAVGLQNTGTIRGKMYSTADDESLFLKKLQDGSLLAQPERDRLLDTMRRQVYRLGVPAGVGVPVANKVGFIDGLLHDAAIVYGPKTYQLVILTKGSTWAQIADAARQINTQINR